MKTLQLSNLKHAYHTLARIFSHNTWLLAVALFLLALGTRIAYYISIRQDALAQVPILDAKNYSDWATRILERTDVRTDAFFVEPGYAYVLSWVYKIFPNNYEPMIFLQILLGSILPVLLFFILKKFTKNIPISFGVSLLAVFFESFIFYDTLLLKTSLELFLITLLLFFLTIAWPKFKKIHFFGFGFLIGIIALIKANIFYTLPFMIIAILLQRNLSWKRRSILSACFVLGALTVIAPISYLNFQQSHSFVLINSSGGANAYIGNWQGADGSFMPPEFISVDPDHEETNWRKTAEAYSGKTLSGGEVSTFWMRSTLDEIRYDISHFIAITFKKIFLLYTSFIIGDNYSMEYAEQFFPAFSVFFPFWIIITLGTLGGIVALRTYGRQHAYLYALFIGYAATLIATHVAERYRLALAPIAFIFLGSLLLHAKDLAHKARFDQLIYGSCAIIALLFFVALPQPRVLSTTLADTYNSFGSYYLENEDFERADRYLLLGYQRSPLHEPIIQKRARSQLLQGNIDRSIALYQEALRARYNASTAGLEIALETKKQDLTRDAIQRKFQERKNIANRLYDPDYIDGMALLDQGEYVLAEKYLERASRSQPENDLILTSLASIYKQQEHYQEAEVQLNSALDLNEYNLVARYNLANLYSKQPEKAMTHYQRIDEIVPNYQLTRLYLAQTYIEVGQINEALDMLEQFADHAQEHDLYPEQRTQALNLITQIKNQRQNASNSIYKK